MVDQKVILSEFSDDNCQESDNNVPGNGPVDWTHGWNDDRITSYFYRYLHSTTTHNPWHKYTNINSYRTQADPTKSSIKEYNDNEIPDSDLINRPKVTKYQGNSVTLWKGDRASETLTTGVVATNDDECHSNRNNLPDPDAVIIERIPYLDNFYHADVKTQKGVYPDGNTGSNFTPKNLKAVLDSSVGKVKPCKGTNGYGYWMDDNTVKCLYQKTGTRSGVMDNGPTKLSLLSDIKSIKKDNEDLWSSISSQYCLDDISDRGDDLIDYDGNTCNGIINNDEIYSGLCTGEDIKNDTCKKNLSTSKYADLAKNYCTSSSGIKDDWCSCYNVTNFQTVCQTYPEDKAGCEKAHAISKNIADSNIVLGGGQDENVLLQFVAPCGELCASTSTWNPDGYDINCGGNIQVCNQLQSADTIYNYDGSLIDLSQECNFSMESSVSSPGSSPTSSPTSSPGPSPGPGPGPDDEPEFYEKTEFIIGGTALILLIMCSVLLLLSSRSR